MSHPLVSREQSYQFERKQFSVESCDRDVKRWPRSAEFQFDLPWVLSGVQAISLGEITLPSPVSLPFPAAGIGFTLAWIADPGSLAPRPKVEITLTPHDVAGLIPDDFNLHDESSPLLQAINHRLTSAVDAEAARFAAEAGIPAVSAPPPPRLALGTSGANRGCLSFTASGLHHPFVIAELPPRPGLPAGESFLRALGFYAAGNYLDPNCSPADASIRSRPAELESPPPVHPSPVVQLIKASQPPSLVRRRNVYMEVEGYNSYGETCPPSSLGLPGTATTDSFFAKVSLSNPTQSGHIEFVLPPTTAYNFTSIDPPSEKIARLKVRFRYHDGEMVNFGASELSFTLFFDIMHNEIPRQLSLRTPLGLRPT